MVSNSICHVELSATDFDLAKKFYFGLFGWTDRLLWDKYVLFATPGDGADFGLHLVDEVHPSKRPILYVHVDQIGSYVSKSVQLGGTVLQPKTENPSGGWFAVLADPFGNAVGLSED